MHEPEYHPEGPLLWAEIRKKLITSGLHYPDDIYDYLGGIDDSLPIMFHGTSRYLLPTIEQNGLGAQAWDFELLNRENPRLAASLERIVKSKASYEKICLSMGYGSAKRHAEKGPETLSTLVLEEHIVTETERAGGSLGWSIDDIMKPGGYFHTLLMSVLDPKPIVLHIKPIRRDMSQRLANPETGYFVDPDRRRELLESIRKAICDYRLHLEGRQPSSRQEADHMWHMIQPLQGVLKTPEDFNVCPEEWMVEAILRSRFYQVNFDKIDPERIVKIVEC